MCLCLESLCIAWSREMLRRKEETTRSCHQPQQWVASEQSDYLLLWDLFKKRLNLSQQVIVNQTDKKLKCFSPSEKPQSCKPVIPKAGRYRTSPDQTPQSTSDSGTACADNIWEACEKETAYKVQIVKKNFWQEKERFRKGKVLDLQKDERRMIVKW